MASPRVPPVSPTPRQVEELNKGPRHWTRPTTFLKRLPSSWSVLDVWKLPSVVPEDEDDHGSLVAGLARTDMGAFAPGALAQEAPISTYEEIIACIGLAAFFTAPAFGPLLDR